MTTIAFTGHRPKDLPAGFGEHHVSFALDHFLTHPSWHPTSFITGGALGIDTWAAAYALTYDIPLTIILPFAPRVMGKFWNDSDRDLLESHLTLARTVQILSPDAYDPRMYQKRNEAMVNAADRIIAFWTGKDMGGTYNCLVYANLTGKPVVNLMDSCPISYCRESVCVDGC